MASGTRKENEKKQDKYVQARISGKNKEEAKREAGYAATTRTDQIEKPGSPAQLKIMAELERQGIDEKFLVSSYKSALAESKSEKGRVGDYNAHAKLLLQMSYLMGLGKKDGPGVAIQINNGPKGEQADAGGYEETLREIRALRELLKEKIIDDQLPRVHERGSGPIDADAYHEVVGDAGKLPQDGSGGQP